MRKLILLAAIFAGSYTAANAQIVTKDSLNALKQHKQMLELRTKINKAQTKLAKEQNNLVELQKDSADYYSQGEAATKAINNRSGDVSIGDVASSKKASRAAAKAEKINRRIASNAKDIRKSRSRIDDYNSDLEKYNGKLEMLQKAAGMTATTK